MSARDDYWQAIYAPGAPVASTCLSCPPRPGILRYRDDPSPGFGFVVIHRDDVAVASTFGPAATLIRKWRGRAKSDPKHAWTITIEGPMSGVRYTRIDSGRWLATHRSQGFA